jgi:hypothetical protein
LIPAPAVSLPEQSEETPSYGAIALSSVKEWRLLVVDKVPKERNLVLLAFIIAVAGISKATEPLFTTYIQGRYGFSPAEVSHLRPYVNSQPMLKQY